jgi:nucleotide-binding universal stress UspA family protein
MTTHERSGIWRWLLGSVTDRIVRHSGDPVLVVPSVEESP